MHAFESRRTDGRQIYRACFIFTSSTMRMMWVITSTSSFGPKRAMALPNIGATTLNSTTTSNPTAFSKSQSKRRDRVLSDGIVLARSAVSSIGTGEAASAIRLRIYDTQVLYTCLRATGLLSDCGPFAKSSCRRVGSGSIRSLSDMDFLFPPRPENAIPPDLIKSLEARGFVGQHKFNSNISQPEYLRHLEQLREGEFKSTRGLINGLLHVRVRHRPSA
jgi:hypothetical protein